MPGAADNSWLPPQLNENGENMQARWKAVMAIAAGILVYECWQCNDQPMPVDRAGEITIPTDGILYGEFVEYNKDYFDNKLPYTTFEYTDIIEKDGSHESMADVVRGTSEYHVRVDKRFNPILKTADISLLHELCHIKLDTSGELPLTVSDDDAHGPKFQQCMVDLATRGALHDLW
jgi:hypothetical protein